MQVSMALTSPLSTVVPWTHLMAAEVIAYAALFYLAMIAFAAIGLYLGADAKRHNLGRTVIIAFRLSVILALILMIFNSWAGPDDNGERSLRAACILCALACEWAVSLGFDMFRSLSPVWQYLATGKVDVRVKGQNLSVMNPHESCLDHLRQAREYFKAYLKSTCLLPLLGLLAIVPFATADGGLLSLSAGIGTIAYALSALVALTTWIKPLISRMQSELEKLDRR